MKQASAATGVMTCDGYRQRVTFVWSGPEAVGTADVCAPGKQVRGRFNSANHQLFRITEGIANDSYEIRG